MITPVNDFNTRVIEVFKAAGVDEAPECQDMPIDAIVGTVGDWSVGVGCYGNLLFVENVVTNERWGGVLSADYDSLEAMATGLLRAMLNLEHELRGQIELLGEKP